MTICKYNRYSKLELYAANIFRLSFIFNYTFFINKNVDMRKASCQDGSSFIHSDDDHDVHFAVQKVSDLPQ